MEVRSRDNELPFVIFSKVKASWRFLAARLKPCLPVFIRSGEPQDHGNCVVELVQMSSNSKSPRLSRSRPQWQRISGGVTAARGFLASGVAAEIKKQGLDLAVVFSSKPS